jgi:hypothetical protein
MIRMSRVEFLKDLSVFDDRISWLLRIVRARDVGFPEKTCKRGAPRADLSDE